MFVIRFHVFPNIPRLLANYTKIQRLSFLYVTKKIYANQARDLEKSVYAQAYIKTRKAHIGTYVYTHTTT